MRRLISYMCRKALAGCILAGCGFVAASCGNGDRMDVDSSLEVASYAISDGDYGHAQELCNVVLAMMSEADSVNVDETQAGRLGILYMRLSEHQNEDENIADATQCIRYAFRQSDDSLKAFSTGLSLDDVRHFVLLRRIGLSIDYPVDLTNSDMSQPD